MNLSDAAEIPSHQANENTFLAKAIRKRVDANDKRGAVRIFLNDGRLIEPDEKSVQILRSKHLTEDACSIQESDSPPHWLTDKILQQAINGMPAGGAP